MTPLIKSASTALLLAASAATVHAATFEAFSAPGFTTESTSLTGYYYQPVAPAGDTVASFSVLSTTAGFAQTATVSFAAPITSFTFLWGSPDAYNVVSDGAVTVDGSSVTDTLYTFTDSAGFSSLTFTTTSVAFEVAQMSAVPEPTNALLMLAGLVVFGLFVLSRQKRNALT